VNHPNRKQGWLWFAHGWLWFAQRTTARGDQLQGSAGYALVAMVAALLILAGCDSQPVITPTPTSDAAVSVARGTDDLSQSLDSLRKFAAGGDEQPALRSIYYLNQWLNGGRAVEGPWEPDRLVANIPRALKNTPGLERLDDLVFRPQDLAYMQQTQWLSDVAKRVRQEPPPADLRPWLKEIEKSPGLPEAEQLAAAERLFDWTIRNLQLDELPPLPKGPVATAGEETNPITPAMLGEVGPGYAHLPIQLLVEGHGDAHERARVFILLCRQVGVNAVILARIDETVSSAPQPWVAAVLAGSELYLFDPQLGLPIPGPGGQGIATLAEALADPKVLRQLDVPGGPAYPFAPADLKNIVALIEAQPESLARRFELLEQALPSSRRMVLATHPSQLEPRLRKSKGIGSVSLWRVPLEALQYQIGRMQLIGKSPERQLEYKREERLFASPGTPLMLGRNYHLQGQFESRDQLPGARTLYMRARTSDAAREKLYTSEEFRKLNGFTETLPENEDERKVTLETINTMYLRAKQHASYWLGLVHYEEGNYDAAVEWLDLRTLQSPLPSPWAAGARYNLARAYEALGQNDKAIAILQADDSPQRHGNLLRAARLAR
jgi:tetratricopeptide (TPR) repeat protein